MAFCKRILIIPFIFLFLLLTIVIVGATEPVWGDLNSDCYVNTTDVVVLRRHIAGGYHISLNEWNADVNEDGQLDTTDVVLLRRYIAGGYDITLKPSAQKCEHIQVVDKAAAPSYTQTGLTEGSHCELCGFVFSEQQIIDMKEVGYSHFSLDDFYLAFEDLTVHADVYESIFDNSTFAWLKKLHETTGATVSCYCFYQNTDASFTLDMVPAIFASEFQANKDWLRFGFHAKKQGINYANASAETAQKDYEQTIQALIRITGGTECIDRMPRLHNFAGSLAACRGMQDAECRAVGFLAAIAASDGTPRQSYYLNDENNLFIFEHDYFYDRTNQVHFVRTQDGGMIFNIGKLIGSSEYANLNTYVEFFTHENQLTDGTKAAYISAYRQLKNTHMPIFWMDIFKSFTVDCW